MRITKVVVSFRVFWTKMGQIQKIVTCCLLDLLKKTARFLFGMWRKSLSLVFVVSIRFFLQKNGQKKVFKVFFLACDKKAYYLINKDVKF